jgi:hypothetical protein
LSTNFVGFCQSTSLILCVAKQRGKATKQSNETKQRNKATKQSNETKQQVTLLQSREIRFKPTKLGTSSLQRKNKQK